MKGCQNACWPFCPLVGKEKLNFYEIEWLAQCTMMGKFGNGAARQQALGRWYPIVQGLVNYFIAFR